MYLYDDIPTPAGVLGRRRSHRWAVSEQSLWQLAGGIAELVATLSLLIVGGRLLKRTLSRPVPEPVPSAAGSSVP